MSRQILFCLLAVSWICLCFGSNLPVSEASAILSSHYGDQHAYAVRSSTQPTPPSNVHACTGETDIILDYSSTTQITICGTDFGNGVSGDPDQKEIGVTVAGGFHADIVDHGDTYLIINLPTNGAGAHLSVRLTLGSWSFTVPELWVTFPQPIVTDIYEEKPMTGTKRSAAQNVVIIGKNFGTPSTMIHIGVTIGSFTCFRVQHVSDTEIRCSVTGTGANQVVIVVVNGQSSAASNTLGGVATRFDFPNPMTNGLACVPPFGSADALNPEVCNCWSGSAPSDNLLSTDCDLHAVCAGHITTQPLVSQWPPARPDTQFKDDKLWIKQVVPIVKNRRDTIIQFAVPALDVASPNTPAGTLGSTQCNFPGTLWAKKLNNLDCLDEFYGVLPWSQHEMCGFVEHKSAAISASPYRVWKTNLVTSYTETYKKSDGRVYFRKISNSYLLSVSFTRQVVVLTTTPVTAYIADQNAPMSLEITVMGDALYDVASKNTLIQFKTTIVWPYQFDAVTLEGYWTAAMGNTVTGSVSASADLFPGQPGQYQCTKVQDTICEQAWILTVDSDPDPAQPRVCNLQGAIEFNTQPLLCRDYTTVGACQGAPSTNFTIKLGKTDLCDDAPASDASAGLNAQLDTFYDAAYEIQQSTFQTGDMVYFKLTVQDPSSTIDQVTFKSVTVRSSTVAGVYDDLYYLPTDGAPVSSATTFHVGAQFNITQERRETSLLSPNEQGHLGFNFRLLRDQLSVVSTLASASTTDMTKTLTVEAVIDILYHGNQKRSFVATSNVPAVTHTQIAFYDVEDVADEDLTPHNNDASNVDDDAKSLFASAATSTVVASVAAVVCAVAAVVA